MAVKPATRDGRASRNRATRAASSTADADTHDEALPEAGRTPPGRRGRPTKAPILDGETADSPEVGHNLRRLRLARELSLEALAKSSGVSRAMLSQIELGHST